MSALGYQLLCGDYRDVLADVECDALILDAPYSERTHDGDARGQGRSNDGADRSVLAYQPWTPEDVRECVRFFALRTRDWMVSLTDDVLAPAWRAAYREIGRYDFPPVPVLQHKPRRCGDGPGSGAVYLMVSRPRESRFMKWGSLPGWYEATPERDGIVHGAKGLGLMRAIVRDYSRPGDLVCDPCAGGGTTLLAALCEKRRAIGAELDPVTHAKADARLRAWCEMPLFDAKPEQQELLP